MKIKFIETTRYLDDGKLLKSKYLYYPSLTFPLLAALTPAEHEVSITYEMFDDIGFEAKPDVVGITSITSNVYRAYEVADEFRRRGVHVVMGGIHVSMEPEEAAEHADTVFIGEAEETWPQFLRDFQAGLRLPSYRAERPPSLENLPIPRWDLVDQSRYLSYATLVRFRRPPAFAMQTSRGCCFSCDYCSTKRFQGYTGFRPRPIPDVINEINALGAKNLFFMDDNIFSDTERAKELFRALIPLKVHWGGQGVIAAAGDEEMIGLARRSGCYFVVAGLESITPAVLEAMGKKDNKVGSYERNLRTFRRNGIDVDVSMMFGFDEDEPDVFKKTCDFLIKNKAPYVSWLPLTPFPGTAFYKKLKIQGRLKYERWWLMLRPEVKKKIYTLLYTGAKMSDEEFLGAFYKNYRRFYSLGSIARRLLWPPKIRNIVTIGINLSIGRKISTQATVVEH